MISPAERIRELCAINEDVAAMVQSAGQAIDSLTNRPLSQAVDGDDTQMVDQATADARKEAFAEHTKAYYTSLQAVVARLRRQAYALEEAGIIAAEPPGLSAGKGQGVEGSDRITNGGLGNLDVGWLNSRGNKVGAEKEGELLADAMNLLEETLAT